MPSNAHTLFNGNQTAAFQQLCARAISTWTSLSDTLPHDVMGSAVDPFGWLWVTQSQVQSAGNRRDSIPAAATQNAYVEAQHPCKITGSDIYFALDPNDPAGPMDYFWADSCESGCLDYVFSFLGAAVHEYGHALGLDHVADATAVMYPSIEGGAAKNDPIQCEVDFVRKVFRDNFGPAALDSFVVAPLSSGQVSCTWSVNIEKGCRRYRLSKTCEDGTAYVLADSMPCLGPGVGQAFVDSDPCPGQAFYSLSLVDSIGPSLVQEIVLAEQGYVAPTLPGPMRVSVFAGNLEIEPEVPGFATPEDAVRGLGVAVTERDDNRYRQARADGFMYFTLENGLFWGGSIDAILEDQMRVCLAASDSTVDSLAFDPHATVYPYDTIAQVTAGVRYVHQCQTVDVDWRGQVVAIVERRSSDDGWRVRQVTEVW